MAPLDGFSTKISYSTDGTSYTDLACIYDAIEPGSYEVDKIETTCHDTPDNTRTYIPGLQDEGEAKFKIRREPGSSQDLNIRSLLRQTLYWKITYPNNATDTFQGFISGLGGEIPMGDGTISQDVTITISGKVVSAAS